MGRSRFLNKKMTNLTYREVVALAQDRASHEYLIALMREFGGNVIKAAESAGIERESLHRLLRRYGIRTDIFKDRPLTPPKL